MFFARTLRKSLHPYLPVPLPVGILLSQLAHGLLHWISQLSPGKISAGHPEPSLEQVLCLNLWKRLKIYRLLKLRSQFLKKKGELFTIHHFCLLWDFFCSPFEFNIYSRWDLHRLLQFCKWLVSSRPSLHPSNRNLEIPYIDTSTGYSWRHTRNLPEFLSKADTSENH